MTRQLRDGQRRRSHCKASKIRELEYRMTIRFGAMLAAAVAVLAALITFVK